MINEHYFSCYKIVYLKDNTVKNSKMEDFDSEVSDFLSMYKKLKST